jgi:hypothetical protein
VLPDPGGETDHGRLLGLEVDVGELERRPLDAVAGLVLERPVDVPHLDRDAQRAELFLVALEHLLERLDVGRLAVALDDLAEPGLADVGARDEERDQQVEQSLTLARGHVHPSRRTPPVRRT